MEYTSDRSIGLSHTKVLGKSTIGKFFVSLLFIKSVVKLPLEFYPMFKSETKTLAISNVCRKSMLYANQANVEMWCIW